MLGRGLGCGSGFQVLDRALSMSCLCASVFPSVKGVGQCMCPRNTSSSSETANAGGLLSLPEGRIQTMSLWIACALHSACIQQTLHKCVWSGDWIECYTTIKNVK